MTTDAMTTLSWWPRIRDITITAWVMAMPVTSFPPLLRQYSDDLTGSLVRKIVCTEQLARPCNISSRHDSTSSTTWRKRKSDCYRTCRCRPATYSSPIQQSMMTLLQFDVRRLKHYKTIERRPNWLTSWRLGQRRKIADWLQHCTVRVHWSDEIHLT